MGFLVALINLSEYLQEDRHTDISGVSSVSSLLNSCAPHCFNWMVRFGGWFFSFLKHIKDFSLPSLGLNAFNVARSKLTHFCLQADKFQILIVFLALILLSKLLRLILGLLIYIICVWHYYSLLSCILINTEVFTYMNLLNDLTSY